MKVRGKERRERATRTLGECQVRPLPRPRQRQTPGWFCPSCTSRVACRNSPSGRRAVRPREERRPKRSGRRQDRRGRGRRRTIISSCWVSTVCDFETALLEAAVVVVVDCRRARSSVCCMRTCMRGGAHHLWLYAVVDGRVCASEGEMGGAVRPLDNSDECVYLSSRRAPTPSPPLERIHPAPPINLFKMGDTGDVRTTCIDPFFYCR